MNALRDRLMQATQQSRQCDEALTVGLGLDDLEEAMETLKEIAEGDGLTFVYALPENSNVTETSAFADNGDGPQVWRVNLTTA